jgi:hypothetical protein
MAINRIQPGYLGSYMVVEFKNEFIGLEKFHFISLSELSENGEIVFSRIFFHSILSKNCLETTSSHIIWGRFDETVSARTYGQYFAMVQYKLINTGIEALL